MARRGTSTGVGCSRRERKREREIYHGKETATLHTVRVEVPAVPHVSSRSPRTVKTLANRTACLPIGRADRRRLRRPPHIASLSFSRARSPTRPRVSLCSPPRRREFSLSRHRPRRGPPIGLLKRRSVDDDERRPRARLMAELVVVILSLP